MATAHTSHKENEHDKEKTEKAEEQAKHQKKEPPKSKGQIDAERAGQDVPEEEAGKPTEAREWIGAQREREERADFQRFKAEYATKRAEKAAK